MALAQFFGDEAEVWFDGNQDAEQPALTSGFQQQDLQPQIEDAWDHFVTDDDEWVTDDYALVDVVVASTQYYGDGAELEAQDDDEQINVDQHALVDVALAPQYFGEDAELADQEDDDYVVIDGQVSAPDDPVFADQWDHFADGDDETVLPDDYQPGALPQPSEDAWDYFAADGDDDQALADDYALIENLSPVEDAWDWWSQDDDDQVDVAEFAFISVAVTTLQYYGDDAELADLDLDDVEWQLRDTDVLAADFFAPPQFFGDDAELEAQEGDEPLVLDEQLGVPDVLARDDGWDHFVDDLAGDDTAPTDDYQSVAPLLAQPPEDVWDHFGDDDEPLFLDEVQVLSVVLSPLLCAEDAWNHWPAEDDDYAVPEDYQPSAGSVTAFMTGVAIAGGLSFGTCLGMMPVVFQQYDPRFFNGSNAWLGYRTSSGGGVW